MNYRVAICDDNKKDAEYVQGILTTCGDKLAIVELNGSKKLHLE